MRSILFMALSGALAGAPAGAQSVVGPAGASVRDGPNAQAAQRPLGPNAQAAVRPAGPNVAIIQERQTSDDRVQYPSCAAAGTVRATPIRRGEPGYARHLDRDRDGLACE